jgi:hypothetical protein
MSSFFRLLVSKCPTVTSGSMVRLDYVRTDHPHQSPERHLTPKFPPPHARNTAPCATCSSPAGLSEDPDDGRASGRTSRADADSPQNPFHNHRADYDLALGTLVPQARQLRRDLMEDVIPSTHRMLPLHVLADVPGRDHAGRFARRSGVRRRGDGNAGKIAGFDTVRPRLIADQADADPYTPHRIASHLHLARSTVGRVLARYGMPKLANIDQATGLPVRKPRSTDAVR